MNLRTQVVTKPPKGVQKIHELEAIDLILRPQLVDLPKDKELRVWPEPEELTDFDNRYAPVLKLQALVGRYLRKEWPNLRVRRSCGTDYVRIGYFNADWRNGK